VHHLFGEPVADARRVESVGSPRRKVARIPGADDRQSATARCGLLADVRFPQPAEEICMANEPGDAVNF
jgi:hypothetical protein